MFFNGTKTLNNWEEIELTGTNSGIRLSLPEDWKYTENRNDNGSFGLSLYHCTDTENTVSIEFSEAFGVCGTGLRTEETRINSYAATMGIYDGNPTFDYIVFDDTPGFYVIYNNADAAFWQEHEDDLRAIFSTVRVAEDIIFRYDALKIAEEYTDGENVKQYGEFDTEKGIWSFFFESDEISETIKIDKNGNIA